MFTEEQFVEIRKYLDLRRFEIQDIKQALKNFPETINYNQINWDIVYEIWMMFIDEPKSYPIYKIILDNWCENFIRDIIIDDLEDFIINYDERFNTIIISEIIEKENHNNWEAKLENYLKNTKFNYELILWA